MEVISDLLGSSNENCSGNRRNVPDVHQFTGWTSVEIHNRALPISYGEARKYKAQRKLWSSASGLDGLEAGT
ncbi:MAG TPA: hypothetical protein DCG12_16525 [Planctomycetaceae bacterium]|nr:hypothetical protein [Planctomycetaceae bacterium]